MLARVRAEVEAANAEPLVMPQDEYELVKWVFELIGGPAFPGNAVFACRIAAKRNFAGCGDVFARLAEALSAPVAPAEASPSLGAGQGLPMADARSREPARPVLPVDRDSLREIVRSVIADFTRQPGPALRDRITDALWPLLEHAQSAAAGSHEGVRLWMLDCGNLVQKHREHAVEASARLGEQRERAEAAEATLAALRSVLLEGGQPDATARRRALAIIGVEEADHG